MAIDCWLCGPGGDCTGRCFNQERTKMDRRLTTPDPKPEPNGALREIAARLKKLSYRDMKRLADEIVRPLPSARAPDEGELTEALLAAADRLEAA
jgi:hypothetical protein